MEHLSACLIIFQSPKAMNEEFDSFMLGHGIGFLLLLLRMYDVIGFRHSSRQHGYDYLVLASSWCGLSQQGHSVGKL